MESSADRIYRRTLPQLLPRLMLISSAFLAAIWAHATYRQGLVAGMPGGVQRFYLVATSSFLVGGLAAALCGVVAAYFYRLREQQRRTSLSEVGLAIRAIVVAVMAFLLVAAGIALNNV